jgi:hypothetical protein
VSMISAPVAPMTETAAFAAVSLQGGSWLSAGGVQMGSNFLRGAHAGPGLREQRDRNGSQRQGQGGGKGVVAEADAGLSVDERVVHGVPDPDGDRYAEDPSGA